ncbi:MoaF-related domain-containing protein [Streptomyces olivoreticuli]|uniref:MoaF-related domain-containing protein n=1 Tax=Streptomyces olivoreticuli TaxID=68246 RepID=UPI000E260A69|nr:hypothetical protein [Streptomyces olivoreticuli]
MKFPRFMCAAVPVAFALCCTSAPSAEATPSPTSRGDSECTAWERGYEDATVPAVGQTWTLDFGVNSPVGPGPFVATIAFASASQATIKVVQGPGTYQGLTQDITYTSTRLRSCQYVLTWHEPKTGLFVTQVEDYSEHRAYDTVVDPAKGTMIHFTGTLFRAR